MSYSILGISEKLIYQNYYNRNMEYILRDETRIRIDSEIKSNLYRFNPLFQVTNNHFDNYIYKMENQINILIPMGKQDEFNLPLDISDQIRVFLTHLVISSEFNCFQELDSEDLLTDLRSFNSDIDKLKSYFRSTSSKVIMDENILYSGIDLSLMQGYSVDYERYQKLKEINLSEDILLLLNNKDHLMIQFNSYPCYSGGLNASGQYEIILIFKVFQLREMSIPFIRY